MQKEIAEKDDELKAKENVVETKEDLASLKEELAKNPKNKVELQKKIKALEAQKVEEEKVLKQQQDELKKAEIEAAEKVAAAAAANAGATPVVAESQVIHQCHRGDRNIKYALKIQASSVHANEILDV